MNLFEPRDVRRDFDHWKQIADHMAAFLQKPYMVIENARGEYLAFPASRPVTIENTVIYRTDS